MVSEIMTNDKIIESICNIVIAVSAAAAAIGALHGINSWQKESRWKLKQEIINNLLKNIYKIRNACNYLRSYKTFSRDFPSDCDVNENPLQAIKNIYEAKVHKLDDHILTLNAYLIEAEMLLDRRIIDEIFILFKYISRLKKSYQLYFERNLLFEENVLDDADKIVMADVFSSDDTNELTKLFKQTIQKIETLLKSYLK
ncbi:MAG TPA: hypothetical protein PK514_02945 [Spirochaetota bacterium]|nr:hypothetical protein [Spirochaetota bacterium]